MADPAQLGILRESARAAYPAPPGQLESGGGVMHVQRAEVVHTSIIASPQEVIAFLSVLVRADTHAWAG
jgi:hypothetical protein